MALDNKLSMVVENQFPSFYKEEGAKFLQFVKAYYEYMEQEGKSSDALHNLRSYKDINETLDKYFEYFRKTLLPNVPSDIAADKRLFAKYISDFNQSRGTLNSLKLMFRALYNEDVDVYFPGQQILKVSDGDWRKERYLITPYTPETYEFIGRTIQGTESQAEALVEDIVKVVARSRDLMKIVVSNVKGSFNHDEPIRIKGTSGGHSPIIEAGINKITVTQGGQNYRKGDVLKLVSEKNGIFGKGVVTGTKSSGGVVTFDLVEGGSGYTATYELGGTRVEFIGGDGYEKASFELELDDIVDTFAISMNTNLVGSNNIFGDLAPVISFPDRSGTPTGLMSTYANTPIGCPHFGFPEYGEEVTRKNFHEQANAVILIANTKTISTGMNLYGQTSGANAHVKSILSTGLGTALAQVDGYKLFTTSETVNDEYGSVGTVTSYEANTIGYHILQIGYFANSNGLALGDGVKGLRSGAKGVIKHFGSTVTNGWTDPENPSDVRDLLTLVVTSNNNSSISPQFDTGPMKAFEEDEPIIQIYHNDYVGNAALSTSNTIIENVYTKLRDALIFKNTTFGTISRLSHIRGGSGYTIAPKVRVRENDIASLGIGESYLRLQSQDQFFNTGNSQYTKIDSNDKIEGQTSYAIGDVKAGVYNQPITVQSYANGVYETWLRVWQRPQQRSPGNINWKIGEWVTVYSYNNEYVPYTADTRTVIDTGDAQIVEIIDKGILGDNARVSSAVGANGIVTSVTPLDSGYGYSPGEEVELIAERKAVGSEDAISIGTIGIHDVANTQGYYATNRSHLSSLRGYLSDNEYYNEYAYEVNSALPFEKYKEVLLKLVHPSGQGVFGKYVLQSNLNIDIEVSSDNKKLLKGTGSVSITNATSTITGSGTSFTSQYSNGDIMTISISGELVSIPLNIVSSDTSANSKVTWSEGNISSAGIFYNTGSI